MGALRLTIVAAWVLVLPATAGAGVPDAATDVGPRERDELLRYAADTWHSLASMTGDSGLPADRLLRDASGRWAPAIHTSPSDIAAYLWSVVAAEDLHLLDRREAGRRLGRALDAVVLLARSHGFFFNWYDVRTGRQLDAWPTGGRPLRPFLSTVNNAWLATALIVVGDARPDLHDRVEDLLEPMDFEFFYEPYDPADAAAHPGQLHVGFFDDTRTFTRGFYGLLNSEARIATYLGIAGATAGRALLPPLPDPASGVGAAGPGPGGESRAYRGVPVFEGHYTYHGLRLVPSWGGSMFEALMVPLFVPEEQWAPESWGVNHPLYVRAAARVRPGRPAMRVVGLLPGAGPRQHYAEYGVGPIAVKPGGYPHGDAEEATGRDDPVHGVVAPYASFLALRLDRAEALANLRRLARRPAAYGEFGFVNSVDVGCGRVSDAVLAVNQGMILAAIANAVGGEPMRRHFARGRSRRWSGP